MPSSRQPPLRVTAATLLDPLKTTAHPDSEPAPLTEAQRKAAQRAASSANLSVMIVQQVLAGGVMILFATDVLGLEATVIGLLLALQPAIEVLRVPLLGFVESLGTRRAFRLSAWIRLGVVVLLLLLPLAWLTLPVFGALLFVNMAAWIVLTLTAWGPTMFSIATVEDRGEFFGRMRARFSIVQVLGILLIALGIGETMTLLEYKAILVVVVLLMLHRWYWESKLPEAAWPGPTGAKPAKRESLWQLARRSRLFRAPLVISILILVTQTPAIIMYLRQGLDVPANLVTAYLTLSALGAAFSLVLWGKLSDALGYRPVLMGLQILSLLVTPLLFLVVPFPEGLAPGWQIPDRGQIVSLAVLGAYGFFSGAFTAGIGIGQTSLVLAHLDPRDALRLQGLLTTVVSVFVAVVTIVLGDFVTRVARSADDTTLLHGLLHTDLFKSTYVFGIMAINLVVFTLTLRMPNLRPEFSLTAFFTSLFVQPGRHLQLRSRVTARHDEERLGTARWFGRRPHPLALDPLIRFLDDPSYDVRVEAIRSLAVTRSHVAAARLRQMLEDPEEVHFWEHVAWALGELRAEEAIPVLAGHLANETLSNRTRAMCAGALGRLQALPQAGAIAAAMESRFADSFLRTFGARALLKMRDDRHAELVLRVLDGAEFFQERYELMTLVADRMGLDVQWLLDGRPGERMPEMLRRWLENQATPLAPEGEQLLANLSEDDRSFLRETFLERCPDSPSNPWLAALRRLTGDGECSGALHLLLAAWLLVPQPAERPPRNGV